MVDRPTDIPSAKNEQNKLKRSSDIIPPRFHHSFLYPTYPHLFVLSYKTMSFSFASVLPRPFNPSFTPMFSSPDSHCTRPPARPSHSYQQQQQHSTSTPNRTTQSPSQSHVRNNSTTTEFAPTLSLWKQCRNGDYNTVQSSTSSSFSSPSSSADELVYQFLPAGENGLLWVHPDSSRTELRHYRIPSSTFTTSSSTLTTSSATSSTTVLHYQRCSTTRFLATTFSNWVFDVIQPTSSTSADPPLLVLVNIYKWNPYQFRLEPLCDTFSETLRLFHTLLTNIHLSSTSPSTPQSLIFHPFQIAFTPLSTLSPFNSNGNLNTTLAPELNTLLVRTNTRLVRTVNITPVISPTPTPSTITHPPKLDCPIYRFKVTAEMQPDVYSLWVYHPRTRTTEKWGAAYVSDIRTSQQLNRLFRYIREMDNLDYIEESDDESDFEDARADKHVNLSIAYSILCQWVPYCNKWQPVRIDEAVLFDDRTRTTPVVSAPVVCDVLKKAKQFATSTKQYYVARSHRTTYAKLKR